MVSRGHNPIFALILAGMAIGIFITVIGIVVVLHETSTHRVVAHF